MAFRTVSIAETLGIVNSKFQSQRGQVYLKWESGKAGECNRIRPPCRFPISKQKTELTPESSHP